MPLTKLFFFVVAAACMAIFLAMQPRLTFDEKKKAFLLAVGAFPLVGLLAYLTAGTMHHEAYEATAQALPETGTGLSALASFCGLAASGVILWGASHINNRRTYEGFLEVQRDELRAIERAKTEALAREERMLEGKVKLARLEAQGHFLAIERDQARLQADEQRAAQDRVDQAFLLKHKRYCQLTDIKMDADQNTLDAQFRRDMAAQRIGRVDLRQLENSQNPEVQRILHGRAAIKLTPDNPKNTA